jgi:methyl-accepting chemotaxis protein
MLDAILLPIGEGNRILAQISNGKIDELIAQTYKGDHEKMKQAVNNVAVVVQGLQKEMARLTDASRGRATLRARQARAVPGRLRGIVRGVNDHAGRHPAAHRRRQPHSGADLQRQDRRTDCARPTRATTRR